MNTRFTLLECLIYSSYASPENALIRFAIPFDINYEVVIQIELGVTKENWCECSQKYKMENEVLT